MISVAKATSNYDASLSVPDRLVPSDLKFLLVFLQWHHHDFVLWNCVERRPIETEVLGDELRRRMR